MGLNNRGIAITTSHVINIEYFTHDIYIGVAHRQSPIRSVVSYDWLACGIRDSGMTHVKMSSYDWRSFFIFFGTGNSWGLLL